MAQTDLSSKVSDDIYQDTDTKILRCVTRSHTGSQSPLCSSSPDPVQRHPGISLPPQSSPPTPPPVLFRTAPATCWTTAAPTTGKASRWVRWDECWCATSWLKRNDSRIHFVRIFKMKLGKLTLPQREMSSGCQNNECICCWLCQVLSFVFMTLAVTVMFAKLNFLYKYFSLFPN